MLLKNPLFWSLLHHAEKAPFLPMDARKILMVWKALGMDNLMLGRQDGAYS